jgi:hypothetical protein
VGVPTLSDDRVRVRALRESDVAEYVGAFGRDDELLDLLGYEGDPEPAGIERWFAESWVEPPELRQWEFAIADTEPDDGSAAFQLVLDWAFDEPALERIEITALPQNVSIPHLAELGFTYEGTMRKRNVERGRRVDLLLWSLLREERLDGPG